LFAIRVPAWQALQALTHSSCARSLSGITSIMFCGIVMAKYCRPNLSAATDERVGAFFRVIAYLAEIFVFIYIGGALFTDERAHLSTRMWAFVIFSLGALALSRAANVYPITGLCNLLTPAEGRKVPQAHKHMLWFSGLRGAMAFALANLARDSLAGKGERESEAGDVILAATFFMVRTCCAEPRAYTAA
jgi:solute carrier family 9 (sodium/hydrogen exchanger), member 8